MPAWALAQLGEESDALSRIREAVGRGLSTDEAVAHGIRSTAGVVTSAAAVMVGVFAVFATLSMLMFKQFGVGLATAILIDATIVRGVLLPASMKLLGDWNWYLPRWLRWLPRFDLGDCSPTVAAGHAYSLRSWYRSSGVTQFAVYLRDAGGTWHYWTSSPWFAAAPAFGS